MRLFKGVVMLAGVCILLASGVSAQEEIEEFEVEMFFAPAETVSSTVQHDQPLELSPSAVTVFTREDIRASGARSIPELLRQVPNMDVYLVKPLWYAIGARGVTTIVSDSALLLVNGRDVTIDFFGAPFSTVQHFSMDDVERVEVIRGPGSALYGASAYCGVVNVILPQPDDVRPAMVSVRGGEHGFAELSGSVGQRFGPLALSAQIGYEHENLWTGRGTGREVLRGRLNGSVKIGDRGRLYLEGAAFDANGLFYTNIGQSDLKDGYYAYGRAIFSYEDLELQAIYDQMGIRTDFGLVLDYGGLELASLPELDAVMNKFTLRAKHTVNFWHNRATYGAEYIYNQYNDDVIYNGGVFKEHRGGIYVQDEMDLGAILEVETPIILTLGLRFDFNSITQFEFSPRAAVVTTPWPNHSFRLGYAHAFQKPTYFESSLDIHLVDAGFGFDRLSMVSELENETIDSVELGYHGSFLDQRLIVKVDLAYNWYRDLIVFDYELSGMEYITIGGLQIPDLKSKGFQFFNEPNGMDGHNLEVQAILRPTDRSRIFFQAGYRQLFERATNLFRSEEPIWNLGAGLDLSSRSGFAFSLRAYFTSERTNSFRGPGGALEPNLEVTLPAYWLLNARIAWQLSQKPFALQAGVEGFNLLNMTMAEYGGVPMPNDPDFAAERLSRRLIFFLRGEL